MLLTALTILQVFVGIAIIALVLLQRGRGADAGAGFGAGASGSVFGARGATTGLSRATAIFAAIFMVNSLALAWIGTRPAAQPAGLLEGAGIAASESSEGNNEELGTPALGTVPAPADTPAP